MPGAPRVALARAGALAWAAVLLSAAPRAIRAAEAIAVARDPQDDWRAAAALADRVSRLSDRIRQTAVDIQAWKRKLAGAREYHQEHAKRARASISAWERQRARLEEQLAGLRGYEASQEGRRKAIFCSAVLRAFHLGDHTAKVELLRACHGLGLLQGSPTHNHTQPAAPIGLVELQATPAEDMEERLRTLEDLRDEAKAEYHLRAAHFRTEQQRLSGRESELAKGITELHRDVLQKKKNATRRAYERVKDKFCPTIIGNDANRILEFAQRECN